MIPVPLRRVAMLLSIVLAGFGLAAPAGGAGLHTFAEPPHGPFVDVGAAPVIVVGTAGAGRSVWSETDRLVYTLTPFRVEQTLRGRVAPEITIRTLGGRLPSGLVQVTQHEPVFRAGQRSRLFLDPAGDEYRVRSADQGKQDDSSGDFHSSQACQGTFCFTGQKFALSSFPLVYLVNANTADVTGEETAITAGFQVWEDDPGSLVDVTNGGATGVTSTAIDGVQAVYWTASAGNFLARATWFFDQTNTNFHFDVEFNDNHQWTVVGGEGANDIQSVASHEIGHALGLDHPSDTTQVMFEALTIGTTKRVLQSGDLQGIRTLYPSGVTPPPVTGPGVPPVGPTGMLSGTTLKVKRSGSTKGLKKVTVCATGPVNQCATTKKGGLYNLTLPPGTYSITATHRKRTCHAQSVAGPTTATQTIGAAATLDWFCVKD